MASVKDVARSAGVSVGTVSNVLNRPEGVSPVLRERVERAIADLGFVRNESARQLRAGSSRTIAVVVLDVANPFFADVVAGADEAADEQDALVIVCSSAGSAEREARHLLRLEQQRVMGVLLSPVQDAAGPALAEVRRRGTPVVLVDRGTPDPDQSSVAVDDVRGGALAGEHLLALGHRELGFVGGPLGLRQVDERLQGLRSVAPGADVRVVESAGTSVRAGSQAAAQVLGLPPGERPTALFCANDLLAIGVLNECLRRGVRVPEDVALVGYDDISFAATTTVALTSVRQPRELLGRTAVRLLLDQVGDGRGPSAARTRTGAPTRRGEQVLFAPDLVVRASTTGPGRTATSARGRPATGTAPPREAADAVGGPGPQGRA
ncbi:LacI family DNA-binding transcriptional regulator [uncultured Pseudokineococcus sp.]|uniref:LacI family DNA-binding transcriptional regulator n=1 Tax=uncultured Pseudokineococcus sp. TaxID=1642928 RepID=UPI00261832F9|nr:LacI family DNA-binding transcriptional regulator [uncultured Pseudokineococcus sp.]